MSRPACSAGGDDLPLWAGYTARGERVAEETPNSHWHTLVVVRHLVTGGFSVRRQVRRRQATHLPEKSCAAQTHLRLASALFI
jgi:hypothetical protein